MRAKQWVAAGTVLVSALALAGADQDRNEQRALTFMSTWAVVPASELADQYLADTMIQHGAAFKGGKTGYRDFIAALAPQIDPKRPPMHRVALAEGDLVVLLSDQSADMFRFDTRGKVVEKWGYFQPQGAPLGSPSGVSGHEERNRRNGERFLTGLNKETAMGKYAEQYLAADFRRIDGKSVVGRAEFTSALVDALAHGARWHVKHSVADSDMVVFIAANDQPNETSLPPTGSPPRIPALADPDALGSRGSPGCGVSGFASPERDKPGRAAAIALRFDESGKITEYWQVEQPFNAYWACAGRWHGDSLF